MGTCLAITSKNDTTSLWKTLMFIFMHIYPSPLPWNITKMLQAYFGYLEHSCPCPPKAIALTCRKLQCSSGNKKPTWFLFSKKSILGNSSSKRILPDMGFMMESHDNNFHFALFSKKFKIPYFAALFAQILAKSPLASCKKSAKTDAPILRKTLN